MSIYCDKCKEEKSESEIKILKCKHAFCWTCLSEYIINSLSNKNKCPNSNCTYILKDNEVRKVLPENEIERYERICLGQLTNGHTCIMPGCGAVAIFDGINNQYNCTNCGIFNCILCKRAHRNMCCDEVKSPLTSQPFASVCESEFEEARSRLDSMIATMKRTSIAEIDKNVLLPNTSIFNCILCTHDIAKGAGVMLRNCFHEICRECLNNHVRNDPSCPVRCPFGPCSCVLDDRECRESLNSFQRSNYEMKSIMRASLKLKRADHCRGFNCKYMCDLLDEKGRSWTCPMCDCVNCMDCNATHMSQTCQEYIAHKIENEKMEELVRQKKLMRCPECKEYIQKTGGCNWLPCPNCGVELCWILQTYRWGPKGPGDTSGGCGCLIRDSRCHPECGGCVPDPDRRHKRYLVAKEKVTSIASISGDFARASRAGGRFLDSAEDDLGRNALLRNIQTVSDDLEKRNKRRSKKNIRHN